MVIRQRRGQISRADKERDGGPAARHRGGPAPNLGWIKEKRSGFDREGEDFHVSEDGQPATASLFGRGVRESWGSGGTSWSTVVLIGFGGGSWGRWAVDWSASLGYGGGGMAEETGHLSESAQLIP